MSRDLYKQTKTVDLKADLATITTLVATTVTVPAGVTIGTTTPLEGAAADRITKIAKVALAAVDSGGGVFAWQNPESSSIIVQRLHLNVTTQSSGACTIDAGTTATSAATLSDNLIDGISVASAAGEYSNLKNAGTNGKADQLLASGKWVTGSVASGASAGIVGFAYIEYFLI